MVPGASSAGVFLSYRREDAAPYARLVQLEMRERFPDVEVFLDLDSTDAGLDFTAVMRFPPRSGHGSRYEWLL